MGDDVVLVVGRRVERVSEGQSQGISLGVLVLRRPWEGLGSQVLTGPEASAGPVLRGPAAAGTPAGLGEPTDLPPRSAGVRGPPSEARGRPRAPPLTVAATPQGS